VLIRSLRYRDADNRLVLAGHTVHRADLVRYSLSVPLSRDGVGTPREVGSNGVHND
jgi:GntR family transcriptional regulator